MASLALPFAWDHLAPVPGTLSGILEGVAMWLLRREPLSEPYHLTSQLRCEVTRQWSPSSPLSHFKSLRGVRKNTS